MVVGGTLANNLGLIGDERDTRHTRDDIFDVMELVTGGTFTGRWNPPSDRDLLLAAVSDQQSDPLVAIYALTTGPAVSDVAANKTKYSIAFPRIKARIFRTS